ncbi:hypothetical protein ACFPM7_11375 [Actinokineospora guangxiensis]|uniref:Cohesin domain-containing protein n=1 Tax=Actinokineospora guangxiensis TaxID=1490288 RepID=A0ABW0ELM2_9PSEU
MRLLPIALALIPLTACASPRVGALPADNGLLPVVVITWCGDAPAQVDVTSSGISLHYRPVAPLEGAEVELDLTEPGPGWVREAGISDGGRESILRPYAEDMEVVVTVSSEATSGDRNGSGDIGTVDFTLKELAEAAAVLVYDEDVNRNEEVPRGEFALRC